MRKRYPVYKDSGLPLLGEIPEHWILVKVKWLTITESGSTPDSGKYNKYYEQGTINWVRTLDLNNNEVWDTEIKITKKALKDTACKIVPKGTVMIAMYGGDGTIGKNAILKVPATTNQAVCCILPNKKFFSDFLHRYIQFYRPHWMLDALGARKDPNISQQIIKELIVAFPSIEEQKTIARFINHKLDQIEQFISYKRQLIELLKEQKTAIIDRAVTKGLDPNVPMKPSGIEWLGDIPAHWEVRRLKFLTKLVTSGSRGWAKYYSDCGAIFLRIGNLSNTSIELDLSDLQFVNPPKGSEGERTRAYHEDLLISITALIGAVGIIPKNMSEAYVNQHIALIRLIEDKLYSRWVAYCIRSVVGQTQFFTLINGGTKDGLTLDDVKNIVVFVPPLKEQTQIVTYIDSVSIKSDLSISNLKKEIELIKEYRTTLISDAVTGKIDVRDTIESGEAVIAGGD